MKKPSEKENVKVEGEKLRRGIRQQFKRCFLIIAKGCKIKLSEPGKKWIDKQNKNAGAGDLTQIIIVKLKYVSDYLRPYFISYHPRQNKIKKVQLAGLDSRELNRLPSNLAKICLILLKILSSLNDKYKNGLPVVIIFDS